jgi:hypothetical protein
MRPSSTLAALAISVAAACSVIAAPAAPANATGNATDTIRNLEFAGYEVHTDRVGSAPTDECSVTSVRNPHTVTRLIKVFKGPPDNDGNRKFDLVEVVVSKTIQVSLNCTASA